MAAPTENLGEIANWVTELEEAKKRDAAARADQAELQALRQLRITRNSPNAAMSWLQSSVLSRLHTTRSAETTLTGPSSWSAETGTWKSGQRCPPERCASIWGLELRMWLRCGRKNFVIITP